MTGPALVSTRGSVDDLRRALTSGRPVLAGRNPTTAPNSCVESLMRASADAGVGSASPVPLASQAIPAIYAAHPASPPAPTVALPCRDLCLISADALSSVPEPLPDAASSEQLLAKVAERLLHHGWRHVAAPGVAMAWESADPDLIDPIAGWNAAALASLVGPANVGLEAHVSWASAQLDGVRLAVDGACLDAHPYTGTQHLVLEVTRWLARTRPAARVILAVKPAMVDSVSAELAGEPNVAIVTRSSSLHADVVYRPYQMLYAGELDFVLEVGRRGLVGQLDMIGFSNPSYHPSEQLFFFARNLQRHLMRTLDGVTFISAFGRDSTIAECPDLDVERLHVVSCGADPRPGVGALGPDRPFDAETPFLLCLASTFWHKNRAHAIATFADLAERHGYAGHLVVGGPEPYYGRSIAAEDALLETLPDDIRRRVHRWGHVGDEEKWWLLRHAQVVLYPSIVEGFGLVPFEAAAAGTPCLVRAGTAPGELLGETDAVVQSWDPSEWANEADRLIIDPERTSAIIDAVDGVARQHTWELCALRTWAAIDHALARPRRSIHHDDGGRLARVAPTAMAKPGARLRFDMARGTPAVKRRLTRLVGHVRRDGEQ